MSEHDDTRRPEEASPDPRDERLRSLLKGVYPPAEMPEALAERVAWLLAEHASAVRRTSRRCQWRPRERQAVGALAAAALLAALAVSIPRWEHARLSGPASRPVRGALPTAAGWPRGAGDGPRLTEPAMATNDGEMIAARPTARPAAGGARRTAPLPGVTGSPAQPLRTRTSGAPAPVRGARPSGPAPPSRADDLAYIDQDPQAVIQQWAAVPHDEWTALAARVGRSVRVKDDFIAIPFPRLASAAAPQIVEALEGYKREAAVVDPRLACEVTLAVKGTALTDLCDQLREQTSIRVAAGRSVADDKVTVFCERLPLRTVMRAINRLFGYTWLRSGKEGDYRYELEQDLKSQFTEEALRNRDLSAGLLAMDAEMQAYRPYLGVSFAELKQRWDQVSEATKQHLWDKPDAEGARQLWFMVPNGAWAGVQLYYRLTPPQRAALMGGQELVFESDATDPELRIPTQLIRPIMQSTGGTDRIDGQVTPLEDVPGAQSARVRLRLNRSESGSLSLVATIAAECRDAAGKLHGLNLPNRDMVTLYKPAVADLDNATANAVLRAQSPFDKIISLHPNPCCPVGLKPASGRPGPAPRIVSPLSAPLAFSGDVWEAIHRATGLPVVADSFSHLYPISKVTTERTSVFEALCAVSDAMGVRWRKGDDFLLGRSASYLWDERREVPNRYLIRWARDQEASGGLPVSDFLEMATMSDQQLDSDLMAQAMEQYWRLPDWALLASHSLPSKRQDARCLALLKQDQLRRALEPAGIPFGALTPSQQRAVLQLQSAKQLESEQEMGWSYPVKLADWASSNLYGEYVPAGWYLAAAEPARIEGLGWTVVAHAVGGRTAAEAAAAARRSYPNASIEEIQRASATHFLLMTFQQP